MQSIRTHVAAALVGTLVLCAAHANAQTINACQSKKKTCVAKKEAAILKCHNKAEKTGTALDPACVTKAEDKFDGGADPAKGCFAKLESKGGCLTTNDTAALEATVDSFVLDVVTLLDPGYPAPVMNACSAAKKKCVANKAKALLKCHAKAEKTGTLDPACVLKAQTKFDDPVKGCFAKAEGKPPCLTTGDTTTLESTVDAFVQDVVCQLDPATPGCVGGPCPTTYAFKANGTGTDIDQGWSGQWHDNATTSNFAFAGTISGCANPVTPCGQCALTGPSASPAPGLLYRRCRGDGAGNNGAWIQCTTNADCSGTNNACVTYVGPPQPQAIGGVSLCILQHLGSPFAGVVDVDTGSASIPVDLRARVYAGPVLADPCPRCVSGTCDSGIRAGAPCVVDGHSQLFADDVSLDCPPLGGSIIGVERTDGLTLATGAQTLTVAATSPACTDVSWAGRTCQCSTCNNLAGTACHTDADCVSVGATKCGGKRCQSGTNAGTPCLAGSECPGGVCNVPGATTSANQCDDQVCTPNPSDTDSSNEGVCNAGPLEKFCTMEPYRACAVNSDCPQPGDTCGIAKFRECFTDNGIVGGSASVAGVASTTNPKFGAIGCMQPSAASALNLAAGLPGIMRYTLPGTATIN